jgi:hypothetical protein
MLVEPQGTMTEFPKVAQGDLFMTFVDKTQMFGMKIMLDKKTAVLHLNGGQPKVVDEIHYTNRDVLVLKNVAFRFPEIKKAKTGNPDTNAYGSAILSAEGTFVRASNPNGPYDVEIGKGIVQLARNHGGSIWFDSWDVSLTRLGTPEILFAHNAHQVTRTPLTG